MPCSPSLTQLQSPRLTPRYSRRKPLLDRLLAPVTEGQIAEAEAQVHSAQAELDLFDGRSER